LGKNRRTKVERTFWAGTRESGVKRELRNHQEPEPLSQYFFNVYNGLRVVIKTTPEEHVLDDIVDVSLSILN